MNKLFISLLLLFVGTVSYAQSVDSLLKSANSFIMAGDAENAVSTLKKLEKLSPGDNEVKKLFAFTYYNQRDFASALPYANELATSPSADFQQVQMAGLVYKAIAMYKEAEKMYSKALERFPGNGTLLSEYGELLQLKKEDDKAIVQWEKGIASDPNISSNYYFAARHYSAKGNYAWAVLYGEVFMNLESFSERTNEIRTQLIADYGKLLAPSAQKKSSGETFESAFFVTVRHYGNFISTGVNAASLTNVRAYFLKEWNDKYAAQYPFKLFSYLQELTDRELFAAYNNWLFSERQSFVEWGKQNQSAYNELVQLQNSRLFKLPAGQYYPH